MAPCLFLCCSSHATHSMVSSRDGLETGIIIFAISFTIFAVMGVAHFTSGAHFGLPSPTTCNKSFTRREHLPRHNNTFFLKSNKSVHSCCVWVDCLVNFQTIYMKPKSFLPRDHCVMLAIYVNTLCLYIYLYNIVII